MNWTQPLCDDCWHKREPEREPHRLVPAMTEPETCCFCGQPTSSGIYLRIDPGTVPYPRKSES